MKPRRRIRAASEDAVLQIFSYVFLLGFGLLVLIPLMNVLSKAVSVGWAVSAGRVGIWPVGFQLHTLRYVAFSEQFIGAFLVSVFLATIGTALSLTMTAITAYALSKKHLPLIKGVLLLYIFAMLFNGGIVPNYLLVRGLGLLNRVWALILPRLIFVFYLLVLKSFFESIPESLEESARLDGASNMRVLFSIVLPTSLPAIATVSLFYAVAYWNSFFDALLYITRPSLKPLQLFLRDVVITSLEPATGEARGVEEEMNLASESVQASAVIATTVPMLLVYPWLQRYFVKGILIGSVKE